MKTSSSRRGKVSRSAYFMAACVLLLLANCVYFVKRVPFSKKQEHHQHVRAVMTATTAHSSSIPKITVQAFNVSASSPAENKENGTAAMFPLPLVSTSSLTTSMTTTTAPSNITKIVHQTYKSKALPPLYDAWRQECMRLNPDWEFKFWTDEDNRQLLVDHYPHLLQLYDSYDIKIKKIDFIRYVFLHHEGGIYMDMDMVCLRPFSKNLPLISHLTNGNFVVAWANDNHTIGEPERYSNSFMASPTPKHSILQRIFLEAPPKRHLHVLDATGPRFLTSVLLSLPESRRRWFALPQNVIYGHYWNDQQFCQSGEECRTWFPNASTVSMWTGSWMGYGFQWKSWKEHGDVIVKE